MILVLLGTQDKSFIRLLQAIQRQIDLGTIQEDVIVQAGCTKFSSDEMQIFDLIPMDKMPELISHARIVITHGGVGSILDCIRQGKKVIVAARLKKYKEHTNDHQIEIIKAFHEKGYIVPLYNFDELGEKLETIERFTPAIFQSNTTNMVSLIENYISSVYAHDRK